jgi:tetratricopeptide (TPR) repeat protein
MNRLRAPLLSLLLFAATGFITVHADELKDISQLVSQGQQVQALDKVNAYIAAHPKDVAGQFLKGVILAEQNKSADAIKIFSSITEKHPELPEPYNNLAVLYAEQGQYDKARQALEKAIKTHPSYATAHENLGDIYAKMASDAYDKALQLDRSNSRAQTKLSMVKELFSSSNMVAAAAAKPEEPAKVTAAVVPPPAVTPVPAAQVPAEAAKPAEPKAKPAPVPVVKEKEKATEKPAVKEEPKADPQQAVLEAVQGWAKAWSARNVEGYLDYYAGDFKTPNGESRSEWEKTRKERIRKPASIEVEVLNPKVSVEGNHATVAFKQSYRAGGNSMRTGKTLHLKRSGDKWLITQELANH